MKNILVICPTQRDYRELSRFNGAYQFFYSESNPRERLERFDPLSFIEKVVHGIKGKNMHAVIGTHDYPGSMIASIIAEKLGLCGLSLQANLLCQHKYYARLAQKESVPEAVPRFKLIDPFQPAVKLPMDLPFFIKPVKSFFSIMAKRINSRAQYFHFLDACKVHLSQFVQPFNMLVQSYAPLDYSGNFLIAEQLLQGQQVTLEAYVHHGVFQIIGVTDSVMYPRSISFKRFDYPSRIKPEILGKMAAIAKKVLKHIGFDHGICNIEFFYHPSSRQIKIIEINPRMCSQFADLMEKVNGANTYQLQLDLALGKKPEKFPGGDYNAASSFVLRTFKDQLVSGLPGLQEMEMIKTLFPDARVEVYGRPGQKLSSFMQDMDSYLYGIINLGGRDHKDLFRKYMVCKRLLNFCFQHQT